MDNATMTGLAILGSTGSIGKSTLDVVARHPQRFRVVALTAHASVDVMAAQCIEFRPRYAVMSNDAAAAQLRDRLAGAAPDVEVLAGADALVEVATLDAVDSVMAAIVGAAGLLPTLAAARAGKCVMLANKEALVMSGALFMDAVRTHGARLLPIDSEHNAIFQCLPDDYVAGEPPAGVRRIVLTASGGPFRTLPLGDLDGVTPEQACAHPNWDMGRKISVDSASMMNKGLEVIEAGWLFGLAHELIDVVIHPQSLVHSLVEYDDGSILAQMGSPDMRIPISHAMGWPQRIESGAQYLDIIAAGRLEFEAPDPGRFPCLGLAHHALSLGGTAPAVLNAANEIAVAAFLETRIAFTMIPRVIEDVIERCTSVPADSLETVLAADAEARRVAAELTAGDPVVVAR